MVHLIFLLSCIFGSLEAQRRKDNRHIDYSNCGKRYTNEQNLDLGTYTSQPGNFPWHVGVYKYDKFLQIYENICGGTLISPHIVVSAAACVFDPSTKKAHKASYFKIAAGKLTFAWTTPDSNAQEVNVNDISIPETYLGDINSYAENIALLNLAKDVYYNDLVLPICLDMKIKRQNIADNKLQMAGWGLKGDVRHSPILKEAYLQFINIVECRKKYYSIRYLRFINYDKICVLTPSGRRDHDTGGGLVYKIGDRYYLGAILSANIDKDFSPATNVSKHLDWMRTTVEDFKEKKRCLDGFHCYDGDCIEDNLVCDGTKHCTDGTDEAFETCPLNTKDTVFPKGSCSLPSQRGGVSYTKLNCEDNCELKGGNFVLPNERVHINCGKGFAPKETEGRARYVCTNGTWFPEDPECIQMCKGLKKPNLNFECFYKNDDVKCDSFMRPGTIARYSCQAHYTISDPIAFSGTTSCLYGGKWKEELPNCIPDCGIENVVNSAEPTISNANKTVYGKYPWHIGIFRNIPYNSSYVNICGGTLINSHFVLTAAHCMFDPATLARFNESELAVAGGKYKRDWYIHENYQQSARVKHIILPETYTGYHTRYEHDIALLYSEIEFIFDDFILPACLDRSRTVFPPNTIGNIVGWGLTEEYAYSEDLREIHLPVIPTVTCRVRYKNFIQFITSDKFCVIYDNGAGTQVGDSGGGLTIIKNARHYIHGIVSVKKADENLFSAFTNVSSHFEWLLRSMKPYLRTVNKNVS